MIEVFGLKIGKQPAPVVDDELYDEEEESGEDRAKRHSFLILWFDFLLTNTEHRIDTLTEHLADEKLTTQAWAKEFREQLTGAHGEAASIGRRLAGEMAPFGPPDALAGASAWDRQEEYFAKFLADVEQGRYTLKPADNTPATGSELNEKAFGARARSYAKALRGTATDSFKTALGTDLASWILGESDHCQPSDRFPYNCPDLAEESPKPADEWPTSPAFGDTPCIGNCSCFMETEDGKFSTKGI